MTDALAQDIRLALRGLARSRRLAAAIIATLALAVGAATAMFGVVDAALLTPPPFADAERLAMVYATRTEPQGATERLRWSFARFSALRRSLTSAEGVAGYSLASLNVSGPELPEPVTAEFVSPSYFALLRVRPDRGRTFLPGEDATPGTHPVAVIAHDLWTRRFGGSPNAVGGTLRANGVDLTVVGVLPRGFAGLTGRAELWIPTMMAPRLTFADHLTSNEDFISVVARLRPGVTLDALRAEAAVLGPQIEASAPHERDTPGERYGATAVTLHDARVDPTTRRAALVLLGAVGLVTLLACANVATLLLARATGRRREIAVRVALGATRRRIVRQLLTESLVLAAIGGTLGVAIAAWGVRLVAIPARGVAPGNFYGSVGEFAQPQMRLSVLGFAAALTALTAVVFGLAPALQSARADLSAALKGGGSGGARTTPATRRLSARGVAVATEVALALVLLVGGSLMTASFLTLRGQPLGLDRERVLAFAIRPPEVKYPPDVAPAFLERLLARVSTVPGVVAVTVDGCAPLEPTCGRSALSVVGRPAPRPGAAPLVMRHYVGPGHFRVLGIPVRRGRVFTAGDRARRPRVAIVNATAARRFWPGEDPVSQRVWLDGGSSPSSPDSSAEIVGVVGDVPYQVGDDRRALPAVYTPYLQFTYAQRTVMVRTAGDPAAVARAVREAVRTVDPDLALYDMGPLTARLGDAWAKQRFATVVLGAFAAVALILAAVGVYGVVAQMVGERTREIGVRVALGAGPGDVVRLVVRQGMALPMLGIVVGGVASVVATQALRALLFGVSAGDPRVLVLAAGFLAAVALAATYLPARRAARVDPGIVLRGD
jgi:putative ABC transport system permease protein